MDRELKAGYLYTPPNTFLRKSWIKKYCLLHDASFQGIQRLEIFDSDNDVSKPSKIIPLNDCWKVAPFPQKQQPNVFEVRRNENTYYFSAETFVEMSEWLSALQSVAFCKTNSVSLSASVCEKQEENLMYSSVAEPELYKVKSLPTEATRRNNLSGFYNLLITTVNIVIAEESVEGRIGKVILTWPYRHIRRYGYSTDNFSFEAGRKCSSGEGIFMFETNFGLQIFQSIDTHVSSFKEASEDTPIRNESVSPKISEYSFSFSPRNSKTMSPIKKPPRKTKPTISRTISNKGTDSILSSTEDIDYADCAESFTETAGNEASCSPLYNNVNYSERDTLCKSDKDLSFFGNNISLPLLDRPTNELLKRRQSVPLEDKRNCFPPIPSMRKSGPFYSNMDYLQKSMEDRLSLSDIDHFVKNGAEYAQISKKLND